MKEKNIDIFKALADLTRQEILEMIKEHEMCVSEICQAFEQMTQPTISHHLQILKHCDLVDTRREGKMIYYCVNKKMLRNGIVEFIERFEMEI
ncbi:MAG: winged helix-turn-helix transcriptional regulator [Candidatus Omnitrophica bacterium]|nr:winged helix-turn-helix transcriptional regulator [Candidatus Omnitrophota bacterium]